MDRTGKFVVAFCIIALSAWLVFNQRDMARISAARQKAKVAAEAAAKEAALANPAPVTPDGAVGSTTAGATTATAPTAASEAKVEILSTPSVEYSFSNLGGGITQAVLKKHEGERGMRMLLNEFGTTPVGAISEAAGEGATVPYTASLDAAAGAITFDRIDAKQLQTTKRFTVPQATDLKTDYIVHLEVTFTNKGEQPLTIPAYYVYTGSAAPVHQHDRIDYTGFKWDGGKFIANPSFDSGMFSKGMTVFAEQHPHVGWAGVANQYFTTLVTPEVQNPSMPTQVGQYGTAVWAKRFDITNDAWTKSGRSVENKTKLHGIDGALGMPAFTLEPGKTLTQKFQIYAGPREYGRLRLLPNDESDILDFGTFGFVSKTLLNSMNWLHGKLGSYAAAIIVLTLCIKTLLWPMQNKATQSMKRMQLLQPKMTDLREKYKDDPARMNTEVMKLYKDYGVNPLSGCFPMLIQIPIFFGFYNMLGKAVELRNSKFLWVNDLSLPDTIWHIPGTGWPLNVLPLIMAATMLWQMAISPKSGDPTQQRIFMFMPLIFIAFCYNFASALALYWTVQNLFSVVQLYATRNQTPPTLQKVAAPPKRK